MDSEKQVRAPKKRGPAATLLKVLIWLLVIAAGLFLILFLAAKIGQFDTIPNMMTYIRQQF